MLYPKVRATLFIRVNRRFVNHALLAARSISRQRELGEEVAHKLRATIVREYVDVSGASHLNHRPELQAMLASLTKYPVQYVIAEDWSTFGADPNLTTAVLTAVTDTGAELVIGDGALHETGQDEAA